LVSEFRVLLSICFKPSHPRVTQRLPTGAYTRLEMLAHAVGHQELGVFWPAVMTLGQFDLLFAQRLTVRGAGILFVRRAVSDVAIHNDQGRSLLFVLEGAEGALQHLQVVSVSHSRHVPTVPHVPCSHIIAESQGRISLDGDVVVVVDPTQVVEFEVPGQ